MINKIGIEFDKNSKVNTNKNKKTIKNDYVSVVKTENTTGRLNLNYFVPFMGNKNKRESKYETLMYYTDTSAKKLISELKQEAKATGYDSVTTYHALRHALMDVDKYISDLDAGKKDYNLDIMPSAAHILSTDIVKDMFKNRVSRNKILPVIRENIKNLDDIIAKNSPENSKNTSDITFSDDLTDSIWSVHEDKDAVSLYTIIDGAFSSQDDDTRDFLINFDLSMKKRLMNNDKTLLAPFSVYETKAQNVLKNLSLGTNIFVTYDPLKETPGNFLDTIKKQAANDEFSKKFDITELNLSATADYIMHVANTLSKDKTKEHIIIANPSAMTLNDCMDDDDIFVPSLMPDELVETISSPPPNVKFLLYDTRDNYYSVLSAKPTLYNQFDEAAIPVLSTKQMIKSFKENPIFMKDIKIPFSKNAIEKVVEASAQLDGTFPQKTQTLMKKIAGYYVDKKEINEKDVAAYVKETTNLFKKDVDDSTIDVIFDTGKKIKGMVGKESTKKEAELIVKQIKSNKLGTKGVILYSQDGSPGSGRRYTAKAIAGEARVPYIEMNAVDFGTKDVDIFGGGAISPEKAVQKLFSLVRTQAEANPNKAAVLFIENFEYFTLGEMVSFYHQKAMAQLLREMEKANNAGLNILVAGSVSDPALIGEATMKSFKFVDTIEISSPAFNAQERAKIIEHALKENKIKLAGSKEEQRNIINYAAEITMYFPFIQLKNFVKKSNSVADERGHKAVTKGDLTEAYLQLTTGRPAMKKIEPHEKLIVTSHECGHALTLEVMNNVAKTLGKPWQIPSKVNFITLDPRGYYGGAVYPGTDSNIEMSFENVFADIVCSFGGNSAESFFYGMDGSYGISSDMESVRSMAKMMVEVMGLGAKTGKMSISKNDDLSDNMKRIIEDDQRVIINNAKITSDMITEIYADFNRWFTTQYSSLVGTGECMIDGDVFRKALNKWKSEQSPEKQKELELCDKTIVQIMEATKRGIAVRKA